MCRKKSRGSLNIAYSFREGNVSGFVRMHHLEGAEFVRCRRRYFREMADSPERRAEKRDVQLLLRSRPFREFAREFCRRTAYGEFTKEFNTRFGDSESTDCPGRQKEEKRNEEDMHKVL